MAAISRGVGLGAAGASSVASVSSSLKMRSEDAMAACRMLYFSLRSWMGRKKRCPYCMKAMTTPRVSAPPWMRKPPYVRMPASASMEMNSTTG